MKKLLSIMLESMVALTIGVMGDHYNIESKLFGKLYEKQWPAKIGFYKNYGSIEIKKVKTRQGMEIYLYDREKGWYREINEDLTAGSNKEMIDHLLRDSFKDFYFMGKLQWMELRDKLKELDVNELRHNVKAGKEYLQGKIEKRYRSFKEKIHEKWQEIMH